MGEVVLELSKGPDVGGVGRESFPQRIGGLLILAVGWEGRWWVGNELEVEMEMKQRGVVLRKEGIV